MSVKLTITRLGFLVALSALVSAGSVAAQDNDRAKTKVSLNGDADRPNISGLWLGSVTAIPGVAFDPNRGPGDGRPGTFWAPWPLPLTPEYQKIHVERIEAAKAGRALGDSSARCLPFGMPRMLVSKFYPDEIVQTPGQVTLFMYATTPVTIWTDGRGHPADLKPSFNGHSIGYWVDDTLFVDTVGINDIGVLDSLRNAHSDKIHLKWSIRRVADDILHIHLTVHDEKAFTEPVVNTAIWTRKSGNEWAVLDDQSCWENNNTQTNEEAEPGFLKKF